MNRIEKLAEYLEHMYWETGISPSSEDEHIRIQTDIDIARRKVKSVIECEGYKYIPSARLPRTKQTE